MRGFDARATHFVSIVLKTDSARSRRIGIGLIVLATICFSVIDASAKWLVQHLPVAEVVWLRFTTHVLWMLLLLAPRKGFAILRMRSPRQQGLRALMLVAMTALNFWALQYLQLAETGAIQFSVPVLIALMSAWLLGEQLDRRRWVAIIAGFVGVLLVIRPGSAAFHPAILLSVINALLYAAFNMLTRRMAATETAESMQLFSAFGAALLIAPFALPLWVWPQDAVTWAVVALCGLAGGIGHQCVASAHRHASAAVLGPFIYQQIIYMVLWGWLLFGQLPDAFVVGGAVVVVGSGLYLLWLELRARPKT
ncbi:MAG: DMT family transporter [Rubrivivax sp.]|nr:DMT family transporter [Rubrivivax sp.]